MTMEPGSTATFVADAEDHRRELLAYCYRFFGSYGESEDAVQEIMVRAWRSGDGFRGDSSFRTWLFRIAANVCIDMRRAPQRRALPADLSEPERVPAEAPGCLAKEPAQQWVTPIADRHLAGRGTGVTADPLLVAEVRDSVRLAFVAALQLLPPRQRAVLLLRDVVSMSSAECSELLEISVASVNSALARARRTLAEHDPGEGSEMTDAAELELLGRYVQAFEAYDLDALVELLTDDAEFSMPPYTFWMRGADEIARWWDGPGRVCENSRTIATRANGRPAMAVYHFVRPARWEPFAVHIVDMNNGRISALTHFMGAEVFAQMGLPDAVTQ